MKVSVVTSVYNGAEYFDRAIPSILAQDFTDFEFIIVDDGSTDGTSRMLGELEKQDDRIRVIRPGRIGFVPALNLAIGEARGDYIARQDFDDISYPGRLGHQVAELDANTSTGLVGGYYVLVDEKRGECYIRKPPLSHEEIIRAMARRIPFAHTCVMFRKEAWQQAGGYPDVDDIEDLRLWIEFAKLGWGLSNVPEVVGEHFVHAESYWHEHFDYVARQRTLLSAQWNAVKELNMPWWMAVYPASRMVYAHLPPHVKRIARRIVGGSSESDVTLEKARARYAGDIDLENVV